MPRDLRKYLYDIDQACLLLKEFTGGKSFADYSTDAMLRSAVERQFEIIGEALGQALRTEPTLELIDQSLRPDHRLSQPAIPRLCGGFR